MGSHTYGVPGRSFSDDSNRDRQSTQSVIVTVSARVTGSLFSPRGRSSERGGSDSLEALCGSGRASRLDRELFCGLLPAAEFAERLQSTRREGDTENPADAAEDGGRSYHIRTPLARPDSQRGGGGGRRLSVVRRAGGSGAWPPLFQRDTR